MAGFGVSAFGGSTVETGTDLPGSSVIYGARLSLSIGVMGVAVSFVLGIVIGGASGYLGGGSKSWMFLVLHLG